MRKVSLRIALGLAMLAATALAQFKSVQPAPPPAPGPGSDTGQHSTPTFSVKVNLVRLLASVRDRNGAIVTGLSREDFQVIDNGVTQEIAVFERSTAVPLSVSILVDTSGSTRGDLRYEVDSVTKFLHALVRDGNPADTFALYSFNWQVRMETEYGRNARRAETALRALKGEGGTSLYDAIYLASDEMATREGRHVMVVVTDGGDTTSYKKFVDAQRSAQLADAVLYPIVVVPIPNEAGRNMGGEHALDTLAESTGGRIFYPAGFDQLDQTFEDILKELRTQYLLGFYPKGGVPKSRQFHRIQIVTRDQSLRIAARSGYYEP